MENLWKFQSIYELQFFNCPACDYKDKSKQEFVDHACNLHPESVTNLMNISDIDDMVCPWNEIDIKEENFSNIVNENFVKIDKNAEIENNAVIVITSEVKKVECNHCGLKFPHEAVLLKHISLVHGGIHGKQSNDQLAVNNTYVVKMDINTVKENEAVVKSDDEKSIENLEENDVEILDHDINDDDYDPLESGNGLTKSSKIDYLKRDQPEQKVRFADAISQQSHLQSKEYLSSAWGDGDEQDFKCELCPISFNTDKHLKIHIHFLHEKSENKLHCENCDITFKSSQKAMDHFEEVHLGIMKENHLTCKYCGKLFESRKGSDGRDIGRRLWRQHIRTLHENPKKEPISVKCDQCEKVFSSKSGLVEHKRIIHEGFRYECSVCDYKSTQKKSLLRHTRIEHDGILEQHQCEHCGQVLKSQKGLKEHFMAIHENIREYQCDECGKNEVSKKRLQAHKKNVHGDKKYFCDQCGKGFPTSTRLKGHDDSVHKGLMTSKCPYCKEILQKQSLKYHIISKHEQERQIACDQCEQKFRDKYNLKKHVLLVHEGIKNYVCAICNKRFSRNGHLQLHLTTVHEGLKPHKCEVCGTAYGQKGDLKRHKLRAHPNNLN